MGLWWVHNASHHAWAKINGWFCNWLMGSSSKAWVIDPWVGFCVAGHHKGGVICSRVILCGGQRWGHACDNGDTHSEKGRTCPELFFSGGLCGCPGWVYNRGQEWWELVLRQHPGLLSFKWQEGVRGISSQKVNLAPKTQSICTSHPSKYSSKCFNPMSQKLPKNGVDPMEWLEIGWLKFN